MIHGFFTVPVWLGWLVLTCSGARIFSVGARIPGALGAESNSSTTTSAAVLRSAGSKLMTTESVLRNATPNIVEEQMKAKAIFVVNDSSRHHGNAPAHFPVVVDSDRLLRLLEKQEKMEDGKRFVGGYGLRTLKEFGRLRQKLQENGHSGLKAFLFVLLLIQFLGPYLLHTLVYGGLVQITEEVRKTSELLQAIINKISIPLACCATGCCCNFVFFILLNGTDKDYPLLNDVHWLIKMSVLFSISFGIIRVLQEIDSAIEVMASERVTSDVYLKRREFMNEVAYGSHIAGETASQDEHGFFLYRYVWRPVYLITIFVVCFFCFIAAFGFSVQSYCLLIGYLAMMVTLAVFGGRTLGPEIYSGMVLFFDKPFVEGDIITVDKMNSAGGAQTDVANAVVTGFVERIGLRSVVVRRFDMRAVWVPNSYFVQYAVANWNTRPRKLIYLDFAVSDRTPPEVCKAFQEKIFYIIKNHPDIDQGMYTKAVFRKLLSGLNFLIVCFNNRGTKKQFVQQDLLLRILSVARKMEVQFTFGHNTMSLQREEIPCGEHYIGLNEPTHLQELLQSAGGAKGLDLGDLMPIPKPKSATRLRFAPKGKLVVRVEKVILYHAEAVSLKPLGGIARDFSRHLMSKKASDGDDDDLNTALTKDSNGVTKALPVVDLNGVTKAYRVKVTALTDDPSEENDDSFAGEPMTPSPGELSRTTSMAWTRTAQICSHESEDQEARFYENIGFQLKGSADFGGDPDDSIYRSVEFQVMKMGRHWVWRRSGSLLGTASASIADLLPEAALDLPTPLSIVDAEGHAIGEMVVRVYMPESPASMGKSQSVKPQSPKAPRRAGSRQTAHSVIEDEFDEWDPDPDEGAPSMNLGRSTHRSEPVGRSTHRSEPVKSRLESDMPTHWDMNKDGIASAGREGEVQSTVDQRGAAMASALSFRTADEGPKEVLDGDGSQQSDRVGQKKSEDQETVEQRVRFASRLSSQPLFGKSKSSNGQESKSNYAGMLAAKHAERKDDGA